MKHVSILMVAAFVLAAGCSHIPGKGKPYSQGSTKIEFNPQGRTNQGPPSSN